MIIYHKSHLAALRGNAQTWCVFGQQFLNQPRFTIVGPDDVDAGAGRPTKLPARRRRKYVLPDGEITYDWHEAQDLYNRYLARQREDLAEKAKKAETPEEVEEVQTALAEAPVMLQSMRFDEPAKIPRRAKKYKGVDMEVLLQMMAKDEEDAIVALLLS